MSADRGGRDHHPKKSLGQNFLVDPNLQRRIVEALDPAPDDEVLEIGPGLGALTGHLVGRVRRLVLVELDDALAERLRVRYATESSVVVRHEDFLQTDLDQALGDVTRAKVVGNIPYNITTPIIFHLLERSPRPRTILLMVQREVADRLLAPAGSRTYGALAVGVQALADVSRVLQVGRGAFRPAPDVDSTVIRITPHQPPALSPTAESALRYLTRIAFGQRRKQFQRILRDSLNLSQDEISELEAASGFDLRRRPESFSPDDFVALAGRLASAGKLPGG